MRICGESTMPSPVRQPIMADLPALFPSTIEPENGHSLSRISRAVHRAVCSWAIPYIVRKEILLVDVPDNEAQMLASEASWSITVGSSRNQIPDAGHPALRAHPHQLPLMHQSVEAVIALSSSGQAWNRHFLGEADRVLRPGGLFICCIRQCIPHAPLTSTLMEIAQQTSPGTGTWHIQKMGIFPDEKIGLRFFRAQKDKTSWKQYLQRKWHGETAHQREDAPSPETLAEHLLFDIEQIEHACHLLFLGQKIEPPHPHADPVIPTRSEPTAPSVT